MANSRLVTIQDEKQTQKSTSYIGSFLSNSANLLISVAKKSYSVAKVCVTDAMTGAVYGCWNGAFTGAAFAVALAIPCEMGLPKEYRFSSCSPSSKELEAVGGFMLIGAITGAISGAISGVAYGMVKNVYPIDNHFKSTDSTKLKLLKGAALGAGYTLINAAVLQKVFSFNDVIKCVAIPAMIITPVFYTSFVKASKKSKKVRFAAATQFFEREHKRQGSMPIAVPNSEGIAQSESATKMYI